MPSQRQLSKNRTKRLFRKCIKNALKSPERLKVSEWAEKYRDLGDTSAFSGKWSNDITPYLVDIMDSFSDKTTREINFCKPTQVGGTEAMNNMLGYLITQYPTQAMIVYPTDTLAKDTSKDRIVPSLTKTQQIKESYDEKRSKQMALKFRGMTLYITGAGNPGKLASKSVKYLFFDEIDKLDGATKKEASPYNLAKERTRTYPYSKKIYTCSTPTLRSNYVWQIHERAEVQKEYFVPCPHCGKYQILDFHQIKYENSEGLSNEQKADTAVYVCKECGCLISDKEKVKAVQKGEWRKVKGEHIQSPQTVSYHLNCLVSRFLTWREIALEFLKSKDDPDQLQNFVNSWVAEPWEDTKLKTSRDTVMERQTDIEQFIVPDWALMLTAGVDVQESSLYWSIRAFGEQQTSQNIAHGQALSFNSIEQIMNSAFQKKSGEKMLVRLCLIDSGDQTDDVYEFCAKNAEWAQASKGSSHSMLSDFKISKINKADSRANGLPLVIVDTGKYKDIIASRMQRKNGTGSWMVYKGCDEEYADQVTSEHKVNVRSGNRVERKWVQKTSHADNHYLDCEVYTYCAADMCGMRSLMKQEEKVAPVQQQQEEQWIKDNEGWI